MSATFIALDWGTTRARAYLMDGAGAVMQRAASDAGVQSVPPGGFPDVLRALCGPWLKAHPALPVVLAGMVGSRNGWVDVPYAGAPCGSAELARKCHRDKLDGHLLIFVPGVDVRWPDSQGGSGAYDVMRGEEVQVLGLNLTDGLACLPGTHSKWILVHEGRIQSFATFITGELYAAMTASFIGRLAQTPEAAQPAQRLADAAAALPGGLGRALFQARTRVLAGDMDGGGVRPFLSALLVADEIAGALKLYPGHAAVQLVAGEPQLSVYAAAMAHAGLAVQPHEPETTFLAGLAHLLPLALKGDAA